MNRSLKAVGALVGVLLTLAVAGTAGASASSFESTVVNKPLFGHALTTQALTVNGGTVTCTGAKIEELVTLPSTSHQVVRVSYTGCRAFGFINVTVSQGEFDLFAGGTMNILKAMTVNVNLGVLGKCTVNVPKQMSSASEIAMGIGKLGPVGYENNGGKIIEESTTANPITGITYTTSPVSGLCGTGGTNGTYVGSSEVEVEGGLLTYVP